MRASDRSVGGAIAAWLDDMELSPPAPVAIEVSVGEVPAVPETEPILRQPELAIHERPGGGLRVSWEHLPAVAELPEGSTTATVWIAPEAAAELTRCCRFFFSAVLIFLVRRAGWHHVHAATWIDPRGRGWLFAGDWKVGKSTTTALLASRGWSVGGDDVVFLARAADRVTTVARRAPIGLRPGGLELLGRTGGVFDGARDKTFFTPEELGGRWVQRIEPAIVVFPTIGEDATAAEPIGQVAATAELVRWSAWVVLEPGLAQEHLDLLAALARQARSYRVRLGPDLFGDPDLLLELIP